jgi:hypothetical protein
MKKNLIQVLNVVGGGIDFLLSLAMMIVAIPLIAAVLVLFFLIFVIAWAIGTPIKVSTPGLLNNTKVTHYYRWFTRIK